VRIPSGQFGVPNVRPEVQTRHRRDEGMSHGIGQLRLSRQSSPEFNEHWRCNYISQIRGFSLCRAHLDTAPTQTCNFVWSSAFRRPNAVANPNRLKAELRTGVMLRCAPCAPKQKRQRCAQQQPQSIKHPKRYGWVFNPSRAPNRNPLTLPPSARRHHGLTRR
jgi:hypothetical protein